MKIFFPQFRFNWNVQQTSTKYEFLYASSNYKLYKITLYTDHMQESSFSPVWVLMCILKWSDLEKYLEQWSQEKGFSPLCVLLCILKLPAVENY